MTSCDFGVKLTPFPLVITNLTTSSKKTSQSSNQAYITSTSTRWYFAFGAVLSLQRYLILHVWN